MYRLGLLIPFRNRYAHLAQFIPHYTRRLRNAKIFVIEQADDRPFNRAKLFNSGYLEFKDEFDYFIAHDVDLLMTKGDYSYSSNPTQLATHAEQFRYKMPFPEYFGGATMFNNKDFEYCNGFSNNFTSWGGEDSEMYLNVLRCGLKISYRDCYYRSLYHKPANPLGYDAAKMEQAKRPRDADDGLSHCKYEVIGKEEFGGYTKLKVLL